MTNKNSWDNLAEYFKDSNACSADNVEIIEPVLMKEIQEIDNCNIIDFGCGSGNFCRRISPFVESVLGIDASEEMIRIANHENSKKNIKYTHESVHEINISSFNTLNAEAVIQFLSDSELSKLLKLLSGINIQTVVIAGDRFDYINDLVQKGSNKFFFENDNYYIDLNEEKIKLYPRTEDNLIEDFKKVGFKIKKVHKVNYSKQFLEKYPECKEYATKIPAYMVMVFRKQ